MSCTFIHIISSFVHRIYSRTSLIIAVCSIIIFSFSGCKTYDNGTTYFNTYYNMNRLLWESEYDFEGSEILKRQKPRAITPIDSGSRFGAKSLGRPAEIPQFLKDLIIDAGRLQPVAIKLDSVIIKGSKILKLHPKSDFIEGTLLLMAKSFFYKNEWVSCEIKCSELIDRFPMGDYSPDAHLLLAKTYLIERKYALGKTMLSRTVDIAWYKKRYDILSEAFRCIGEQALFEEDEEGALRPYRQAISQSEDGEIRARWQLELASLYYRLSKFDKAEKEYAKVLDESPELIAEFEADLLRASSLLYLKRFNEAEIILNDLDNNENYKDWRSSILAERLRSLRLQGELDSLNKIEGDAEKYAANPAIPITFFERAMSFFKEGKYNLARAYFTKAKSVKSMISEAATKYHSLLSDWMNKQQMLDKGLFIMDSVGVKGPLPDTMLHKRSYAYFQLARIHEQLELKDSALFYYKKAALEAVQSDTNMAKYMYGYQRSIIQSEPELADSIQEILAYNYSKTVYGQDARIQLGFTEAIVIDTLAELFSSGTRFRTTGNYELAARQFLRIAEADRESPWAPKSLYALGWMFENNIKNRDSAVFYYRLLVERYPQSEYTKDIRAGVEMALAFQSGLYNPNTGRIKNPAEMDSSQLQNQADSLKQQPLDSLNDSSLIIKPTVTKEIIPVKEEPKEESKIKSTLKNLMPDIKINSPFNSLLPKTLPFLGTDKVNEEIPEDSTKIVPP